MDADVVRRAVADVGFFAKVVCNEPLWPHQLEAARSAAPIVALLAGRRAGKSRLISVLGTHTALAVPGSRVAILSAGERSALRLLRDEVSPLLRSPLLRGSVCDELKGSVTFSNHSIIEVFSASQKAIRGIGARLVVVDEACFVDRDVWISLYPSVLEQLRAGARVILASSPWPVEGSWFREFHDRGLSGDPDVASFTWPSSVNPNIGEAELAHMQAAMSEEEYTREVEARWTAEEGSWFTADEVDAACLDYPLMSPEQARRASSWDHQNKCKERQFTCVVGLDYGFAQDANSATVLAALEDRGANPRIVHYVTYLEGPHYRMEYEPFIDRLLDIARSYQVYVWGSEINGVGSAATMLLRNRLRESGLSGHVQEIWTDNRRKQAAFSKMKALMQAGTLILPREASLMRELKSLDFSRTEAGSFRIAARQGTHDDQALSLAQGVSMLRDIPNPETTLGPLFPHIVTPRGTIFPRRPKPREHWTSSFGSAQGRERGAEHGW